VEFTRLLDGLDADMSPEEMKIGFESTDSDQNGVIDVDEFIDWWCGT
jgi:Ca2+-binding EF-hand superfamily protein